MPNPQAADNAPLSIDAAVGLLDLEPENDADEGAGEDTQNSAGDDSTPADTGSPDDESEAPSGEDETQPDPEAEELSPIDAPRSWNAEAKAKFASLPRDVQEVISARESERETALSKAQQDAAESRKRAETDAASIGQYKAALDQLLPKARATFENRWKEVDWNNVVDQLGAGEALKLRNQFEQEQEQMQRLEAAQQAAEQVEYRKFVTAEFEKLPTIAPDLADPKEGEARRETVGKFLMDAGVSAQQLRRISALEISLAYDAMRYREARASLAKKKPAAPPARTAVKPTAAKPVVAPQKLAVAKLQERAYRSGRVDDMVALLDAEGPD